MEVVGQRLLPIKFEASKFKKFNAFRSVISLGISPSNLLLDRSMFVTNPKKFLYSSPLPFSQSSTLTKRAKVCCYLSCQL
ncbi:hypothetical protein GYH30_024992 [Glycine max]|uniref:Uncharacterized protein n=2 Tax=Glycine subgen. Soja TaxID=1462606 RepID=A0A0R0I861_SOYBN|nr:hypothetical protein GYH30_024992 [Glycine max]RZB91968.1 hypothetical protein D0Y65_024112 [Glycine soja]